MFPRTLQDWSTQAITEILAKGSFETELFDFKETLPHSKDDAAKTRLRKICCAFANSDGGFIIFGISDDKAKRPTERLVGLEATLDFPEHFGNYPSGCSPSVYWTFRNPPLRLDTGRIIHIVYIPKSWKAPHAVGEAENGWYFAKRTNKGNEGMSLEEARLRFLGYYEKRLKLQLLRSELVTIKGNAQGAYVADEEQIGKSYGLITFDTQVIESVIADTYSITATETDLLQALTEIRHLTSIANNKIRIFFGAAMLPLSNKEAATRSHNTFLRPVCEEIANHCDKAMGELDRILKS